MNHSRIYVCHIYKGEQLNIVCKTILVASIGTMIAFFLQLRGLSDVFTCFLFGRKRFACVQNLLNATKHFFPYCNSMKQLDFETLN